MIENKVGAASAASVTIDSRRFVFVGGVKEVISFDETSVVAETELGCAVVRGHNLRVSNLNVAPTEGKGSIEIAGEIDSFSYEEPRSRKLLGKLFK